MSVILSFSCKDSSDLRGEPIKAPSKATPAGFDVDTAKRPELTLDAGSKGQPSFSKEEIAKLAMMLPALEPARTLKKLASESHSRVAMQTLCMEESLEQATTKLVHGYRAKKWKDVVVGKGANKMRRTITANSQHFRLTATVSLDDKNICSETANLSKISLRFQERAKSKTSPQPKTGFGVD